MKENKSLEELMTRAFELSLDCGYSEITHNGHYFTGRIIHSEEIADRIFGWCDGLMYRYYEKRVSGQCSLQDLIDFDIEGWESQVKADIKLFEEFLERYGKPVVLTKKDLRDRGYRGSWAGYTKEEDNAFYANMDLQRIKELEKELENNRLSFDQKCDIRDQLVSYKKDYAKRTGVEC